MQLEFLRSVAFLNALTDVELAAFHERLMVRLILPGKKIVQEGESVEALYIVVKGVVEVRRSQGKGEVLLGKIPEGSFFGEINLFDPGLATASVYAKDNVSLASIAYPNLKSYFHDYPAGGLKIVSAMMSEACRRLRITNDRLASSVIWWSSDRPFLLPKPPQGAPDAA